MKHYGIKIYQDCRDLLPNTEINGVWGWYRTPHQRDQALIDLRKSHKNATFTKINR